MMTSKVGIIGAGGFSGFELIRILDKHPHTEIKVLNSSTYQGKFVSDFLQVDNNQLRFSNFTIPEINKMELDILFLATPNGEAMKIVPQMDCKIIDLSADYRFSNSADFEKVYGIKHLDKKSKAVYGLPELNRKKIKNANLVANPGCYVTSCILAGLPIKKHAKYFIFDSKSGYSGAGRNSEYITNPSLIKDNIIPYKITSHRHKYEISQFLGNNISFTPHVLPFFQGLLSTCHIMLKKTLTKEKVLQLYSKYYAKEPFVEVADMIPNLHDVQKINYCKLGGFEVDENNQLVVISALDNLIKGASGQAVQNFNIMNGYNEKEGLQ